MKLKNKFTDKLIVEREVELRECLTSGKITKTHDTVKIISQLLQQKIAETIGDKKERGRVLTFLEEVEAAVLVFLQHALAELFR